MRLKMLLAGVVAAGALALPGVAAAQTADYPGPPPPEVEGQDEERGRPTEVLGVQAGLAVTGTDLAGLAVLGGVSVAGGIFLVRRARPRSATV